MKITGIIRKRLRQATTLIRRSQSHQRLQQMQHRLFRWAHKIRGFPSVRPDLTVAVKQDRLLINCRVLDPKNATQSIALKYKDKTVQWIDKDLVHYRTSSTSLSKLVLSADQSDRVCGLIDCHQSPALISSLIVDYEPGKQKKIKLKVEQSQAILPLLSRLLALVPKQVSEKRRAMDAGLGSLISELWSLRDQCSPAHTLKYYNRSRASEKPKISLIIPIYGRYDFIEYQLALFDNDHFMHEQELIYVIDDPRLNGEIIASCDALSRIYQIPFTLLLLERNLGYAGANNLGVEYAQAETVLLLNSDVFPESSGWLEQLMESVGHDLSTSILGARLKYHDESVQHDGMQFHDSPFTGGLWINLHPGKGIAIDQLPVSSHPQPRECITGACLLISKQNYQRLDGLDERYILGDFEDSDLCMKARALGLNVLLCENVSLYHLERQSQSMVSSERWKNEVTYYNCWYHSSKWHDQINHLKQEGFRELQR
ncbi:MAG: glycosyltransferase family 2 protein [Granulosicoccus sp.]|nr:glycosyltransferase family 2 protein [Granulosicoccus sp.]